MTTVVDTLKTSKSLEQAGFGKTQAESLAVVFAETTAASREDLVTKDFLKAELAVLRSEIVGVKNVLVRWLPGSQVALVVILAPLANLTKIFH